MAKIQETLADAVSRLGAVSDTPRLDAEILLCAALGISRAQLLARSQSELAPGRFEEYLSRRLDHEPIAYILGEWEFFSLPFEVAPPALVPRPETEYLVEAALSHIGTGAASVLDIGTGTGCVAISIARNAPDARVTATDINADYLALAARNARTLGVESRVCFRQGNLFDALRSEDGPYDAIVSNPPYVEEGAWEGLSPVIRKHEDPGALLAGPDGLDVIRRLIAEAAEFLMADGCLAIEIGMGQDGAVQSLLLDHGYRDLSFVNDLAGIARIAVARRPQ